MKMKWWKKKKPQDEEKDTEDVVRDQYGNIDLSHYKGDAWDVILPDGMKIDHEERGVLKQTLGSQTHFQPFYIPREGYPRKLKTNWLYALTSSGELDLMVDVHKIPKNEAMRMLQKQITMLKSNLNFQATKGNEDQIKDLQTKIADNDQLMSETQFSENDSYLVSIVGNMYAQDEKELEKYSEYLEDEMSSIFVKLSSTWERVQDAFMSVLPVGKQRISDAYRNIDRRALSTFAPFISGSGEFNGGIPIGNNKITGQKEFYNAFGNQSPDAPSHLKYDNYNQAVFGTSGSGKSLTLKLMVARETVGLGQYTRMIDVEGEFRKITQRLGGINLDIHEESDIRINPLAMNVSHILAEEDDEELSFLEDGDEKEVVTKEGKRYIAFVPLREKQNEILSFFDIICRGKNGNEEGLTVFERNYLEEAIQHVFFNVKEYTSHPDSLYENDVKEVDGQVYQSRVRKDEPTVQDIYKYLKDTYRSEAKAERLIAAIRPFLRDGSKPIFDGQTYLGRNITESLEDGRIVNFNISQMEEGFLRPIAYHVILNYIWEYFVKNVENASKRKIVLADEAWTLIDNEQTVDFLEKMARRSRKRNAGLRIASQDFVRFVVNDKARGILQNTHSFFFLKQKKIDLEHIKENFDLSKGEMDILFGNPEQGEGIMRTGSSSVWLRTDPSNEELAFVESNQAVLDALMERRKETMF